MSAFDFVKKLQADGDAVRASAAARAGSWKGRDGAALHAETRDRAMDADKVQTLSEVARLLRETERNVRELAGHALPWASDFRPVKAEDIKAVADIVPVLGRLRAAVGE